MFQFIEKVAVTTAVIVFSSEDVFGGFMFRHRLSTMARSSSSNASCACTRSSNGTTVFSNSW